MRTGRKDAAEPKYRCHSLLNTPIVHVLPTPDVQVSVRGAPDSSERTSLLLKRLHRDIWQKNARFDIEYGVYYLDPVEQETLWSLCMNVSSDVIQEHDYSITT